MIITLTGNLLAERTYEFAAWRPGVTQRAAAESFQVGGKGINVSKMLIRLGARTVAACFAGGASGDECVRWLEARGFEFQAFRTVAPTRTGAVVRVCGAGGAGGNAQPETTFLGPDASPDAAALAECAAWLDAQPAAHTLAVCGSFPGFLSPEAASLREAITRRIAHGNVCVDTYGPPLAWFAAQPVELVKINRQEFDQLCGQFCTCAEGSGDGGSGHASALSPANPMSERLSAACRQWPVRRWIITDGPGPVWFASRDEVSPASPSPPAYPASLQPPAIREASPTGSGDVFFAVTLHNLKNLHFSLAEAVANAIPCASANASNYSIAEINMN